MSRIPAAYDRFADWYDGYLQGAAKEFADWTRHSLAELLGRGPGTCADLGCGTGQAAEVCRGLGWAPIGFDLSLGQLQRAVGRLPVVVADIARLPVRSASVPVAVCVLCHTDTADYASVCREAARILRPGGRFVHVGVHPCFTGAFADRSHRGRVVVSGDYWDRRHRFDGGSPDGVRARVGARHLPVSDLINAITGAGLRLRTTSEAGTPVPALFSVLASKPDGDPFATRDLHGSRPWFPAPSASSRSRS